MCEHTTISLTLEFIEYPYKLYCSIFNRSYYFLSDNNYIKSEYIFINTFKSGAHSCDEMEGKVIWLVSMSGTCSSSISSF